MANFLQKSGIKSVDFYTATPVETCERCGAGIKNVALVNYRDGTSSRYGSECINKILAQAPSMKKLFNKNAKLLKLRKGQLAVLSLPPEQMPRGGEYYGSGMYMIADVDGRDVMGSEPGRDPRFGTHYFWHPMIDWEKNQGGGRYVQKGTPEEYRAKALGDIEKSLPWFQQEVTKLENFLGRILEKARAAGLNPYEETVQEDNRLMRKLSEH